jgi:hypothetical protein
MQCGQHINAVHSSCREKEALVKQVPVVIGRIPQELKNVGVRLLLVGDIDSDLEADTPVNLPQAGYISNLPVDLELDYAGSGGPETYPE